MYTHTAYTCTPHLYIYTWLAAYIIERHTEHSYTDSTNSFILLPSLAEQNRGPIEYLYIPMCNVVSSSSWVRPAVSPVAAPGHARPSHTHIHAYIHTELTSSPLVPVSQAPHGLTLRDTQTYQLLRRKLTLPQLKPGQDLIPRDPPGLTVSPAAAWNSPGPQLPTLPWLSHWRHPWFPDRFTYLTACLA